MPGHTSLGGGGESRAGTEVDGHSAAIGSTTDTESVSGNGSVIALLKRHRTLLVSIILLLGGGLPTLLLSGALSTNTVAAKATAAAPAYVEGTDVKLSTDLAGALRTASGVSTNPTAGRLDSIRYLQKLDTLNLIRAGRLDSLRRVQKTDTLSLLLAGRLDSLRRVQKVDTVAAAFINPATLAGVAIPAANTGATLTIPAAGAGLFHYVTAILLQRSATAALAGTALLAVTTTNLPGALQWRFGNLMVAGETRTDLNMSFVEPIKSSVANTATTVVVPAPGAAVSWTVVVHYYTGP
jgi:hypothetical protein